MSRPPSRLRGNDKKLCESSGADAPLTLISPAFVSWGEIRRGSSRLRLADYVRHSCGHGGRPGACRPGGFGRGQPRPRHHPHHHHQRGDLAHQPVDQRSVAALVQQDGLSRRCRGEDALSRGARTGACTSPTTMASVRRGSASSPTAIRRPSPTACCAPTRASSSPTASSSFLNEDEQRAVVAHELGHIVNRDFIVMTAAGTLVQILYQVYAASMRSRKIGSDKSKGGQALVGLAALVDVLRRHLPPLLSQPHARISRRRLLRRARRGAPPRQRRWSRSLTASCRWRTPTPRKACCRARGTWASST